MRGLKQQNYWVMEQQNGITGWTTIGRRIPDAQLRCWAWQTIAHGADAVVFFRWRSCRFGTEQYWHGVLNHDGVPGRRYREVQRFATELAQLSPDLDGTTVTSDVAILNGYDQHFALQIQPQARGLAFWHQVGRYYRALRRMGLNVDIVPSTADLGRYNLVILPSWCVLTDTDARRLRDYVRRGGHLVASPRTGSKTAVNTCTEDPLPGALRDVLGIEVHDYDPLGDAECTIRDSKGAHFTGTVWADALELHGAEAKAWYAEGDFSGAPAIGRHTFGAGTAWYFGTFGDAAFYARFLTDALRDAGVTAGFAVPDGVEVCWRQRDDTRYLFLLNVTPANASIRVPAGMKNLLGPGPESEDGALTLAPHAVHIYRLDVAPRADLPHQVSSLTNKATVPITP
jgi:beta-galactosidase